MPSPIRVPSPFPFGAAALLVWMSAYATPGPTGRAAGGDTAEVARNDSDVARSYDEACRNGSPRACTLLGELYLNGTGVEADDSRAAGLFEEACEAGHANACSLLGTLHTQGRGVPKSLSRAAVLFQKACTLGDDSRCAVKEEPPEPLLDEGRRLHLFLSLGGQVGGEKLLEVSYGDGSTSSLETGAGMVVATGVVMEPFGGTHHVPQVQASIGFNRQNLPLALNGNASWMQWPLELLAFYSHRPTHLRIGGGLQYNLAVSLEGTHALSSFSTAFKNAPGLVLQGEFRLADIVSFFLRYTFVEYRPVGTWSRIPGNTLGFGMSLFVRAL